MLIKLAGDGKYWLDLFHAIRNFVSDEIYYFSGLSYQTGCLVAYAACSI